MLLAATPLSGAAYQRAVASYQAMQTYFYRNDGTSLYHEQYPAASTGNRYSYLWPLSRAYAATLDLSEIGYAGANVQDRVTALGHYFGSSGQTPNAGVTGPLSASVPGYDSYVDAPLAGGGDKYYDDNEWVGLDSVQQFQQTGDASALGRAQTIFTLVTKGWDGNPSHPDPGGVYWTQSKSSQDRNAVSTMPGAELGLRLFQATRNPFYLDWAQRLYNWAYTYLRDPSDGLYWDHINLAGTIDRTKWSYNQGVPIGVNLLFYQVSGNPDYLARAEQLAAHSLSHFGTQIDSQPAAFNAIFFRNLLALYRVDGKPAFANAAVNYGETIWNTRRDAATGLFHFTTSSTVDLLDQAAMTEVYGLLAQTPLASTATVSNTLDSGPGSLRDAIDNTAAGTIAFAIPTSDPGYDATDGVWTIHLASPLMIDRDVKIVGPGASSLDLDGGGITRTFSVAPRIAAEIDGLTISNGLAASGGGGIFTAGTLILRGDALNSNSAGSGSNAAGGAIENLGVLSVYACSLRGNTAAGGGAIDNAGALNLVNSTVVDNTAAAGGALSGTGRAVLVNDSLADNTGGGIVVAGGASVSLYNTIVAANSDGSGAPFDIGGKLDSGLLVGQSPSSNNLIGTGGAGGLVDGSNGNRIGRDPGLGAASTFGGLTVTLPLLASSAAIGAGDSTFSRSAGLSTDQRGLSRFVSGLTDIGAFESQPPALAGDVNHDGAVTFRDLLILAQNYGSSRVPRFESGDLNGDGAVDFSDLLVLAQSYGR